MQYDLSNPLHKEQIKTRLASYLQKEAGIVELRLVRPPRSIKQNRYLWALLTYWGLQLGYTKEEAEAIYKFVSKDYYNVTRKICGQEITEVKHTYELSAEVMSITIDRFRHWSAANCGVDLPAPEDTMNIRRMEMEIERARPWTEQKE